MAIPCFYYADLAAKPAAVVLSQEESAHALQSRRLGVGTLIKLIDGIGGSASGEITGIAKRSVTVAMTDFEILPRPNKSINMAVAMPKGDRQKTLVDMLTQLGVNRLIPVESERTISTLRPNQLLKLRRVSLEACKQSHNPWAMQILEPVSFDDLLERHKDIVYADIGGVKLRKLSQNAGDLTVLIGPEGGFSAEEIKQLSGANAQAFTLGHHILRTETAAIAAAAQCVS